MELRNVLHRVQVVLGLLLKGLHDERLLHLLVVLLVSSLRSLLLEVFDQYGLAQLSFFLFFGGKRNILVGRLKRSLDPDLLERVGLEGMRLVEKLLAIQRAVEVLFRLGLLLLSLKWVLQRVIVVINVYHTLRILNLLRLNHLGENWVRVEVVLANLAVLRLGFGGDNLQRLSG